MRKVLLIGSIFFFLLMVPSITAEWTYNSTMILNNYIMRRVYENDNFLYVYGDSWNGVAIVDLDKYFRGVPNNYTLLIFPSLERGQYAQFTDNYVFTSLDGQRELVRYDKYTGQNLIQFGLNHHLGYKGNETFSFQIEGNYIYAVPYLSGKFGPYTNLPAKIDKYNLPTIGQNNTIINPISSCNILLENNATDHYLRFLMDDDYYYVFTEATIQKIRRSDCYRVLQRNLTVGSPSLPSHDYYSQIDNGYMYVPSEDWTVHKIRTSDLTDVWISPIYSGHAQQDWDSEYLYLVIGVSGVQISDCNVYTTRTYSDLLAHVFNKTSGINIANLTGNTTQYDVRVWNKPECIPRNITTTTTTTTTIPAMAYACPNQKDCSIYSGISAGAMMGVTFCGIYNFLDCAGPPMIATMFYAILSILIISFFAFMAHIMSANS